MPFRSHVLVSVGDVVGLPSVGQFMHVVVDINVQLAMVVLQETLWKGVHLELSHIDIAEVEKRTV